jgi:glucose/arabinose dehydrogenase
MRRVAGHLPGASTTRRTPWSLAAAVLAGACSDTAADRKTADGSIDDVATNPSGDSARPGDGTVDASGDATWLDSSSGDATWLDSSGGDATRLDSGSADARATEAGREAAAPNPRCNGSMHSTNAAQATLPPTPSLTVPAGFTIQAIANIGLARQMAALPNGDLLVATQGTTLWLVPNAEAAGSPGTPVAFANMPDWPAQGITFEPSSCVIYVGTQSAIYAIAYSDALQSAAPGDAIAHVRTGGVSGHFTTSVTLAGGQLYASVGSSCNACIETDPTRATVQVMAPTGANMTTRATRIRNAIALTTNPATGTVWAGVAGQDTLPAGHPYEFFDAVTLHPGIADYGWPDCEENHQAYTAGADCTSTVAPLVELPAYSTLIGAAFYPLSPSGSYAFPAAYRGGVFIAAHGSWHQSGTTYVAPPRVAFVPMNGDAPRTAVDWNDPTAQWTDFVSGFQLADGATRVARPTGVAVGAAGSLFVSDDQNGFVYRIRPM